MTEHDPARLDTPLDARGKPAMAALVEEVNRLSKENKRTYEEGVRQGQRFERARSRAAIEERLEAEASWVDPVLRADLLRIVDDA